MAEIQVTSSTLRSKAEELNGLNERFRTEVNALIEEENTLRGQFEGQASDAFHAAFARDMTQMQNFYNAIAQYIQKLVEIAGKYEEAEAKNVSTATTRKY